MIIIHFLEPDFYGFEQIQIGVKIKTEPDVENLEDNSKLSGKLIHW